MSITEKWLGIKEIIIKNIKFPRSKGSENSPRLISQNVVQVVKYCNLS